MIEDNGDEAMTALVAISTLALESGKNEEETLRRVAIFRKYFYLSDENYATLERIVRKKIGERE